MALFTRSRKSKSDDQLVEDYKSVGDMGSLGILFDRYQELIYGVCMKYLKDPHDSEDATIAIFEELHEKLKVHDVRSFRSWLYVLTKNHCLQLLRQGKQTLTNDSEAIFMHLPDEDHHDDEYFRSHMENGLRECIELLPDKQRRTVELFYFEAMSYIEIANDMNIDKDKVRSYIQNGRRNLKNCMNKKIK